MDTGALILYLIDKVEKAHRYGKSESKSRTTGKAGKWKCSCRERVEEIQRLLLKEKEKVAALQKETVAMINCLQPNCALHYRKNPDPL